MTVRCFLLAPTDRAYYQLRIYTLVGCEDDHGHSAGARIGDGPLELDEQGYIRLLPGPPPSDPRWPTVCARCGEPFPAVGAMSARYQDPIYVLPDGRPCTTRLGGDDAAPPGAMWDCPWFTDTWKGPDGRCLSVVLPSGEHWVVDGPSSGNGPGWERIGFPPQITVTPSIKSSRYHGYLRDGVFTDDMDAHTRRF